MWLNASTLAQNARDVGLGSTLGTIFPIFITPTAVVYLLKTILYSDPCYSAIPGVQPDERTAVFHILNTYLYMARIRQ